MKNVNIFLVIALILAVGVILYLVNNKKEKQDSVCFDLPLDSDPNVFGPKYWAAFHAIADRIPCPACHDDGVKLMRFLHDVVNIKTSKPIFDKANYTYYTNLIAKIKENNYSWPKNIPA